MRSHDTAPVIFECPHCGLILRASALVRPVTVARGTVCPGCFTTVPHD